VKVLERTLVFKFFVMLEPCFVSGLISEISNYVEAVTSCLDRNALTATLHNRNNNKKE
jgi:hypothetical protein